MTDGPLGILVHGDNHFIVAGPKPDREHAIALVRHWSVIAIGPHPMPSHLTQWSIRTKAFRENLAWCWIVLVIPGSERAHSAAVLQLVEELRARGVEIGEAAALP